MPNWCVGSLKIRGKRKDIQEFITQGLECIDAWGKKTEEPFEYIESEENYFECCSKHTFYIPHTRRGFVEDMSLYIAGKSDEQVIAILDTKFAWCIYAEQLLECCKEYHLDMKIYAYECGTEINQDIEIVDGEIVKDDVIKFDDYMWECANPKLGG